MTEGQWYREEGTEIVHTLLQALYSCVSCAYTCVI